MGKYLLKRILFFIPTLIIISLLAFIISINAPGDPLDRMVTAQESGGEFSTQTANTTKEKERWRKKLGLDLPVFYISLSNAATPDTLYKVYDDNERNALKRLIGNYGNWNYIAEWNNSLHNLNSALNQLQPDSTTLQQTGNGIALDTIIEAKQNVGVLLYAYDAGQIERRLKLLQHYAAIYPYFKDAAPAIQQAANQFDAMRNNPNKIKTYLPKIHFYAYNQYHRWIFGDGNIFKGKPATDCKGLIRGDFGYSYETKLPVGDVIGSRIRWSMFFTLVSVVLAYLISLPIGIKAAANKNSNFDKTSSVVLFILYAMPGFWVATLLLMSFANTEALNLFPASGIQPVTGIPADAGWFEAMRLRLPYLILPIVAFTYSQLAFLSRITRVSTLEIIGQDYIRTARAKGLSENKVIYKHAFRNALLPIITVFSNVFPLAIGGSVILETIFTIPGMGEQVFHAILTKDYPVIIDVFTLTGMLTLLGYLFADILYAVADPRISYSSK
ncbi:MAG: ABC transporter permease [Bacteroidetes bacterium]|nr:ABC transporter permease [Bacteroidota bacterium]